MSLVLLVGIQVVPPVKTRCLKKELKKVEKLD
jgi:hypothetical protein